MPIIKGVRKAGHPVSLTTTAPPAVATSYTLAEGSISGVTGSADVLTLAPVGGVWPSATTITLAVSGVTNTLSNGSGGSLSGSVLTPPAGTTTACTVSMTPSTTGTATISATNSGTMSNPGSLSYLVASSGGGGTSSLSANRYDLTIDQSAGPAGTVRTVTATPTNGIWSGGTLSLTAHNGGSSAAVGTVTLPSSGNTAQAISWTPTSVSAGEWIVQGTNTAGMYDPYGAPFNVFTPSSGTARTITASLALLDKSVHQRDTPSGNPLGFSTSWAKGWGEVWINMNSISGASDGIWVQLRDALSSDAALTGWVQVYGPISTTGKIRVLLPAGPYVYHLGVSTVSSGASSIQLAERFKVGHVAAVAQRSYECGQSRSYGYGAGASMATSYTKTATLVSYDIGSANNTTTYGWYVHDGGTDPDPNHFGEGTSSAAEEWGRLIESTYGVCGGFVGATMSLRGLDSFVTHSGVFGNGFGGTISFATGGKAREVIWTMSDWDGVDSGFPTESVAESIHRYTAGADWIARNIPSVATISICAGSSGWFGSDGSRATGYTRMQCAVADQVEAVNPMVVSRANFAWNEYGAAGHSSMAARVQYTRTGRRQARAGEAIAWGGLQTTNRGPTLKSTGATVNSSNLIRIPGNYNGATAISGVGINFANPNWTVGTATSSELASLFSVYGSGGYFNNGTSYGVTSAVINTTSLPTGADFTIDLQVTSPPSTDLSVHYGADFGVDNSTIKPAWQTGGSNRAVFFADNVIDTANGYEFGWQLRPKVDIAVTRI